MARYSKQKLDYDCGPAAIFNALQWAYPDWGFKYTKAFREYLIKVCQTTDEGTEHKGMEAALRLFKLAKLPLQKTESKVARFSYNKIVKHLRGGGAVILSHFDMPQITEQDWHYSFFFLDDTHQDVLYGANTLADKKWATVNEWDISVLKYLNDRSKKEGGAPMEVIYLDRI